MQIIRNIILTLAALICLAGCKRYDVDEILLQREDISLTVKGAAILEYDPLTFQLGYNAQTNEFRVFDDDLGNWFTLKCSSRPAVEGEDVKCDLKWTSSSTTRTRNGLTFNVEKTDGRGYIWLWCKDEAIGVVVKEL